MSISESMKQITDLASQLVKEESSAVNPILSHIEWFLKNHIDYNGLIPNGLAIDATELNIY